MVNKQFKKYFIASILPLALYAAYYVFYPVRDEVAKTHRYVVNRVAHYPDEGKVRFGVRKILEGTSPLRDTYEYSRWPQLKELRDEDIVVYQEITGETGLGMKIEKIIGRKTPLLDWPRLPEIEVEKKAVKWKNNQTNGIKKDNYARLLQRDNKTGVPE